MMSKRIRIRAVLAAAALVAGLAQTAAADTTLTYRSAEGSFTVDMRPGAVRIDDASEQWQLYRRDSEAIFSVRPDERTYTRLDRDVADTIRQRMDTLRAEVRAECDRIGRRCHSRAGRSKELRRLLLKYHPDKNPILKNIMAEVSKIINQAMQQCSL